MQGDRGKQLASCTTWMATQVHPHRNEFEAERANIDVAVVETASVGVASVWRRCNMLINGSTSGKALTQLLESLRANAATFSDITATEYNNTYRRLSSLTTVSSRGGL